MEAKDTVMGKDGIFGVIVASDKNITYSPQYYTDNKGELRAVAKAQAEISFKAGQEEGFILAKVTDPVLLSKAEHEELNRRAKAFLDDVKLSGIKEVVERSNEPCPHTGGFLKRDCDTCWQAQVKDWGL